MNISSIQQYENGLQNRQLEHAVSSIAPISLSEMANVSLLNRIDTKYLFPLSDLTFILSQIQEHYRILDINDVRLNRYHTAYFDEPDFTLYNQHHNQHSDRYKVRSRRYVDTNLAFFEVKHKTNKKRTIKSRLPLKNDYAGQTNNVFDFVDTHTPLEPERLEFKLWNDYSRLTLVGKNFPERVTIDLDLSFGNDNRFAGLPGVVIAEVKQEHFSQNSFFIQQMRNLGIRSSSFSKYCAGVYMLYDHVKTNNFKPVMRNVHKLVEMENFNGYLS